MGERGEGAEGTGSPGWRSVPAPGIHAAGIGFVVSITAAVCEDLLCMTLILVLMEAYRGR